MIIENPLYGQVDLQTSSDGGTTWKSWFGSANAVNVARGGRPTGASTSVDVGTLSVTLVNAGDPLTDTTLVPNLPIRLMRSAIGSTSAAPIFTGNIVDIATSYTLDKGTGELDVFVTVSAADAVNIHAQTNVEGVVTSGGVGYESWAERIDRLALSSTAPINAPADDAPIVRYAI